MYFDTQDTAHLVLIPSDMRTDPELEYVASMAETDVLAYFTYATDEGVAVCLAGYADDPNAAPATLATALRREIAAVIVWRLQSKQAVATSGTMPDEVKKVTHERRSYEFRAISETGMANKEDMSFPQAFPRYLRPYLCGDALTYLS